MKWDAKKLFQILPFYNTFIEKPEIKKLSNIKLLKELPFCDELSIVKNSNAFSEYARSYKVEIVDKKDPLVHLEVSKSSIEDLFKDLLNEIKGFKHQITLPVLLSKIKTDGSIEYSPVYFNSTTKTVINSDEFGLDQSFQEILYRIDNWINQGSGWIVESIEGFYLSVSSYSPLIRSTYIELPDELKNSRKGLINFQNDDDNFLWCHIRHLYLIDKNPQRIAKKDKELVSKLNHEIINFPVSKKDDCKIEVQNKICINMFCYENKVVLKIKL